MYLKRQPWLEITAQRPDFLLQSDRPSAHINIHLVSFTINSESADQNLVEIVVLLSFSLFDCSLGTLNPFKEQSRYTVHINIALTVVKCCPLLVFPFTVKIAYRGLSLLVMYYCGIKFVPLFIVIFYKYAELYFLNFSVTRKMF